MRKILFLYELFQKQNYGINTQVFVPKLININVLPYLFEIIFLRIETMPVELKIHLPSLTLYSLSPEFSMALPNWHILIPLTF